MSENHRGDFLTHTAVVSIADFNHDKP